MNPNSEVDRGRLFRAMEWSYRQLRPFRNLVQGLVKEYAGSAYGQPNVTRPRYEILVNLMNQTVDAYTMALVANRPRIEVTSQDPELFDFAERFEIAMNKLIREIQLERTLRRAVLDAFFCMGVCKMHLLESPEVQLETDLIINPTMPFVSNVALDNWVHDMAAPKYSEVQYAGDWYRIPFEDLKLDIFDQSAIKQLELKPSSKWSMDNDQERLDQIAAGAMTDNDELEPMIDVCDVWIRRDKMIYTFPIDPKRPFASQTRAIAALPWGNPQHGPYPILSFNEVPENVVPSSPASHLSGMARIINNIARKQSRKAHGQKDVLTYTPGGAQSVEKLVKTSDQQTCQVADGSEINLMKFGGVDQPLQAYMIQMMQWYDRMSGTAARMGTGNQAPTLGQEEMLQSQMSQKEASMQYRVLEFAGIIVRHLGYMLWDDKTMTIPASVTVPGLEQYRPTDMSWSPDHREGSPDDYDLDIDIHSMPYQSPMSKFSTMLQLLQNVFIPAGPALAQQGGRVNYQKIAKKAAEVLNDPEYAEFVEFGAPPEPGMEQGPGEMGGPSSSTREYVRRSASSATQPGQEQVSQQAWLGGEGQSVQTVGAS